MSYMVRGKFLARCAAAACRVAVKPELGYALGSYQSQMIAMPL
jgi:hypothetical protein